MLTSGLERERVARALPGAELLDYFAFGFKDLVERGMSFAEAERETVARAVAALGIDEAVVPGDLPLALGDRLRADGVALVVDDDAVALRRRAKSPAELDGIRAAQRAAEAAMGAARDLFAPARPGADGRLLVDGGPLTAEAVRALLRATCAEHGAPCPPDVIVASVWQGDGARAGQRPAPRRPADPGRHLAAPRGQLRCWADMARTFMVGDPAPSTRR